MVESAYGPRGTLWESLNGSAGLTPVKGPPSLENRYVTEDNHGQGLLERRPQPGQYGSGESRFEADKNVFGKRKEVRMTF